MSLRSKAEPVGVRLAIALKVAVKAMPRHVVQSQKTCNYDNYDHDADDVENVHCVLRLTYARLSWLPLRARSSAVSKLVSGLSIASS